MKVADVFTKACSFTYVHENKGTDLLVFPTEFQCR